MNEINKTAEYENVSIQIGKGVFGDRVVIDFYYRQFAGHQVDEAGTKRSKEG
jgi:hypothetical protein